MSPGTHETWARPFGPYDALRSAALYCASRESQEACDIDGYPRPDPGTTDAAALRASPGVGRYARDRACAGGIPVGALNIGPLSQ